MIKDLSLLVCCVCFGFIVQAQSSWYIIKFKDKTGTPFSIDNPSAFLSERSIERRERQHIPIDETDLPIVPRYLDSIRLAGNITMLTQSKWLNQVCIRTTDPLALSKIYSFPFVQSYWPIRRKMESSFTSRNKFENQQEMLFAPAQNKGALDYKYGYATGQIAIHHGEFLHNKGFTGGGMLIAILDGGFYHYKTNPAFDSLRHAHRILDTYDFVAFKNGVNEEDAHGMHCFSIMATNLPGQMIGSCPDASYVLYRTEDVSTESLVEEQNWAAGAERSDSIGADVISTSLGYSTFDNPVFDHTYADMDGKTTIISRAATLAARKGMIVAAAAGNAGNTTWHYITAPGDADSVLTVGAVDVSGEIAPFSSYGPTADGRIKPTAVSVGWHTAYALDNGEIVTGNGTSYATPDLAGLVTCLWQAFPDFTSFEIMAAIKESSDRVAHPDDQYGYGIPDFQKAYDDLLKQRQMRNLSLVLGNKELKVYPNPFVQYVKIAVKPTHTGTMVIRVYDLMGRLCFVKRINAVAGEPQLVQLDQFRNLQRGGYILAIQDGTKIKSVKLVKE